MYNTTQYTNKKGPVFHTGWNKAKVESIEIRDAKSGRKMLVFKVFGEPITTEGFKPFNREDGTPYLGQCGNIRTGWFKADDEKEVGNIMNRVINPMAKAFGIKELLDQESGALIDDSLDAFVKLLNELFTGSELPFIYMNFNGEEYERPGKDRPGINLFFKNITNSEEVIAKIPDGLLKKLELKNEPTATEGGNLY